MQSPKSMSIHVVYRPHPSLSKNWLYEFAKENILISHNNTTCCNQAKDFSLTVCDNYNTTFWECVETKIPVKLLTRESFYPMSDSGTEIVSHLKNKHFACTDLDLIEELRSSNNSSIVSTIPIL